MIIAIPSYLHNKVSEEDCVSSWYSLFIFGESCQLSVLWYLDCGVHRWGVEGSFKIFESISNNNVTSNTWQMHMNIWHDLVIVKVWQRYHVRVGNSRRVCDVRRHQCHWGTRSRYGSCSHLWDRDSTRPNYSENVWDALIRSLYNVRTFLHFLCRLPEQLNPSLPVTKDWGCRKKLTCA